MVVNIDVDITSLKALFNDFLTSIYKPKINDLLVVYPTKKSIEIDYEDLEKFDPDLADKVITHPDIIIEAAKEAIKDLNLTLPGLEKFEPNIRFFNMSYREILIENLKSKNLNEMVCFKGVITRRAETLHKVKLASFTCQVCDSQFKLVVTKNFIPPKRCDSCKKLALQQSDDDSTFSDIQRAETQELLERVRGGAPSAKIELLLEDDLVNAISPGDNVDVVGILRLKPPLKTKQKQELIYGRYIEVVSIKSLKRDFEEVDITKDDEKRILDFSKNPNIEKILIASLAPGIYGHNEVKRAIALQLFGGTKGKSMGGMRIRDDIHILLIGDPGSAKSRFLQQVGDIAPKSIYVSGKSTSGAGLTVTAEKDDLGDGGWTLKAGALVLASGGMAQIDEFDKMDDEDRASMHEAMESGQISVAKAGIVAKFKARTSILAAANPKYGRFDQNKNLADQFAIPPTLLSRFDLIFPIVDILDEEKDSKLAQHILSAHMGIEKKPDDIEFVDKELLRKYISYARRHSLPILTQQALEKIKEFYVDLRRKGKDTGSVAITPRYLEGLVRLAEANAKMRLSTTVDEADAQTSIELMEYVMRKVMTDKATGVFDVDVVATGKPKSERDKLEKVDIIIDIIKDHLKRHDSAEIDSVVGDAASYGVDDKTARKILSELLRKGEIYEKEYGHIRLVGG
ncbi:MAG: minichromosome maintenance protein MCM [Candidatus Micrarchaeota archaeon]